MQFLQNMETKLCTIVFIPPNKGKVGRGCTGNIASSIALLDPATLAEPFSMLVHHHKVESRAEVDCNLEGSTRNMLRLRST